MHLTQELADSLAHLPLDGICREYPNVLGHVMFGPEDVRGPRELHPAFYGCFDWHSSVHGHWMLVRLLKDFRLAPEADVRAKLNANLTRENLQVEADYLAHPGRRSFERMYGWAWVLKLAQELHAWSDADGEAWAEALRPLEEAVCTRYLEFLPKQTYPIRLGTHTNTAFGLTFAFDYSVTVGREDLQSLIKERAMRYFGDDRDNPAHLEPSGADFLSPALIEADLMRRILPSGEFIRWWERFLPAMPDSLSTPAIVSDRSDPQIAHLDGLNLSRAWCMKGIANALPEGHRTKGQLQGAAERHAAEGLANVASGHYEGEHWLASFAIYMLSV
jgi:hypothetical protein